MDIKKIKLSEFERMSLLNQFLIMKGQGKEVITKNGYYSSERIDVSIEILRAGHEAFYSSIFNILSGPIPYEIGEEVYSIVNLYIDALTSFENLHEEQKTQELRSLIRFDGFDSNNELEHCFVLKFIIEKFDIFDEYSDLFEGRRILNSSKKKLSKYRKELQASRRFANLSDLSPEDLYEIFG